MSKVPEEEKLQRSSIKEGPCLEPKEGGTSPHKERLGENNSLRVIFQPSNFRRQLRIDQGEELKQFFV